MGKDASWVTVDVIEYYLMLACVGMYVCVMQHSGLETLLTVSGPWAFLMMEKYRIT
jgi:hypothetical protein